MEVNRTRDALLAHVPSLRAYARALCRDAAAADDLVQNVLLSAWESRDKLDEIICLRAWLFTILRNRYLQNIREWRRRGRSIELDCVEEIPIAPTQETRVEARQVLRVLMSLPRDQREVLLLVAVEGMSCEQAASVLGCSVGTVKSRTSRGRARLQTIIQNGYAAHSDRGHALSVGLRRPEGAPPLSATERSGPTAGSQGNCTPRGARTATRVGRQDETKSLGGRTVLLMITDSETRTRSRFQHAKLPGGTLTDTQSVATE